MHVRHTEAHYIIKEIQIK